MFGAQEIHEVHLGSPAKFNGTKWTSPVATACGRHSRAEERWFSYRRTEHLPVGSLVTELSVLHWSSLLFTVKPQNSYPVLGMTAHSWCSPGLPCQPTLSVVALSSHFGLAQGASPSDGSEHLFSAVGDPGNWPLSHSEESQSSRGTEVNLHLQYNCIPSKRQGKAHTFSEMVAEKVGQDEQESCLASQRRFWDALRKMLGRVGGTDGKKPVQGAAPPAWGGGGQWTLSEEPPPTMRKGQL